MHISKFDLYRDEWLELVFNDRNKEYGAYELRKHYAGNLVKAMGITFFGLAALGCTFSLLHKPGAPTTPTIIDEPTVIVPVSLQPKIETQKAPKTEAPKPIQHIATTADAPMVVTHDEVAQNPPTTEQLANTAIGNETTKGDATTGNPPLQTAGTGGTGDAPKANGDDPVTIAGLDIMPEHVGGANAWAKFLQKNIHYPAQAIDAGAQGRVWLSFVIERDGHLSNITVEKGVGHGLDDEALRVLKLAPAWKPGKQNGQPVRVKYTIPINFILPDNG